MTNRVKNLIAVLLIQIFFMTPALAVSTIQVMALFKNKAVVKIDSARHTLSLGETSPEGVKLISADSEKAVLQVNGKNKTYRLGNATSIGTQFKKPSEVTAQAISDRTGTFRIQGSANGYPINFLVDTGATVIAMNSVQADRLGIDYRLIGTEAKAITASGEAKAYSVMLKKVKVGGIELRNIEAMIIDGGFPTEVLLGMSFLRHVSIKREGNIMLFKKKY